MTDIDSGPSGLASALWNDEGGLLDRLAEILGDAIQELIEDELTVRIGAAPGEQSLARTTQRNGHRPKLLSTPAGDATVRIAKLRKGSFFPELLEPRRRIDKALWAVTNLEAAARAIAQASAWVNTATVPRTPLTPPAPPLTLDPLGPIGPPGHHCDQWWYPGEGLIITHHLTDCPHPSMRRKVLSSS